MFTLIAVPRLQHIPYAIALLPAQHQLGSRLVVELRDDVQTLRLGQLVARTELAFLIAIINQCKIASVDFQP